MKKYNLLKILIKYPKKTHHFINSNEEFSTKNNKELVQDILRTSNYFIQNNLKNKKILLLVSNLKWNTILSYSIISTQNQVGFLFHGYKPEYIDILIDRINPDYIITDYTNHYINQKHENLIIPLNDLFFQEKCSLDDLDIDENHAGIIFMSSGTTNIPKIVYTGKKEMFDHAIYCNKYIFGKKHKLLNILDNAWGASSIMGIFGTLLSGNEIVLYKNSNIYNEPELANQLIKKLNITTGIATPALFRNEKGKKIKLLKLMTTGEKISIDSFNKIKKILSSKCEYINVYGQIEFSGAIATSKGLKLTKKNFDYLKVIPNIKYEVENNLLKIKSHKKCIFNEIHPEELKTTYFDSKKQFITKDIIRKNNKCIILTGRIDNTIKKNGRFIDLDSISTDIEKKFSFKTILLKIKNNQEYVCFIQNMQDSTKLDMISFIEKKYGKYAIPYKIIQMDEFPLNQNFKIDLKKIEHIAEEL